LPAKKQGKFAAKMLHLTQLESNPTCPSQHHELRVVSTLPDFTSNLRPVLGSPSFSFTIHQAV
jgi:hypothetical protein